jgi:hypothetical protein
MVTWDLADQVFLEWYLGVLCGDSPIYMIRETTDSDGLLLSNCPQLAEAPTAIAMLAMARTTQLD